MPFIKYYYYILQYSPLIPIVYYAFHRSKLDKAMKYFLSYLLVSITLTVIMTVLALQKINNLWIMNIAILVYIGLIMWAFSLWQQNRTIKRFMRISIFVFVLIWVVEISAFQKLFEYTTYSRPLGGLLLVVSAVTMIYQLNKDTEHLIVDTPQFWICAGVILYFGGMIFINVMSNPLLKISQDALRLVLLIQAALNFFAHILYTGGFRCYHKQISFGSFSLERL